VAEEARGELGTLLAVFTLLSLGWPALVGNEVPLGLLINQLFDTQVAVLEAEMILVKGCTFLTRMSRLNHCWPGLGWDEYALGRDLLWLCFRDTCCCLCCA
jgi:hypothetical protein